MLKVLFLLLNFVDAVLTYIIVSSGIGFEGNLLMSLLIENGWVLFFVVKMLLALFVIYISLKIPLKIRNLTIVFVCFMYVGIVINNLIVLVYQ